MTDECKEEMKVIALAILRKMVESEEKYRRAVCVPALAAQARFENGKYQAYKEIYQNIMKEIENENQPGQLSRL